MQKKRIEPNLMFLIMLIIVSSIGCSTASKKVHPNANGLSKNEVTQNKEEFDSVQEMTENPNISDPLMGFNRYMNKVNDKIYSWVLLPTAKGYQTVMPESGRIAVGNFFDNMGFPIRFTNNLLQKKFKKAGDECMRFGVNSTAGVLGFTDPATSWLNIEQSDEDFGQTLAHYGVKSGPHIVLPLMGHTNLRDALSGFPDGFLDPLSSIEDQKITLAAEALGGINGASFMVEDYEKIKESVPDSYLFMRDHYELEREKAIKE